MFQSRHPPFPAHGEVEELWREGHNGDDQHSHSDSDSDSDWASDGAIDGSSDSELSELSEPESGTETMSEDGECEPKEASPVLNRSYSEDMARLDRLEELANDYLYEPALLRQSCNF